MIRHTLTAEKGNLKEYVAFSGNDEFVVSTILIKGFGYETSVFQAFEGEYSIDNAIEIHSITYLKVGLTIEEVLKQHIAAIEKLSTIWKKYA